MLRLRGKKMSVSVKQSSPAAACSNFGRPEAFENEGRPVRFGVWRLSQSLKRKADADEEMRAEVPYVHPLVRRSSSSLSQKSLEVCTESLGSETGSDEFSPSIDDLGLEEAEGENNGVGDEEVVPAPVSYNGRKSPLRSFPPPLPSISQRHVPCLHMLPHRVGGRLVVEAVAVPSTNYLQVHRADGRLVLSLTKASIDDSGAVDAKANGNRGTQDMEIVETVETEDQYEEEEQAEEEEEEEEVEVVDRGTVVEVKVSTQPQQQSGAAKIHRSSLVINKFLGGTPLSASASATDRPRGAVPMNSTAAAAAVVAASSTISEGYNYNSGPPDGSNGGDHHHPILDNVLLFTSKRRNRDELLHNVRRCSQLRCRPLFIWEPCCIATST